VTALASRDGAGADRAHPRFAAASKDVGNAPLGVLVGIGLSLPLWASLVAVVVRLLG
jgi:hypothetical protein